MPRFAVLRHEMPADAPRASHWDLFLEEGGVLLGWALSQPPFASAPAAAIPLPPHRLLYLDYEGPLSGDRGHVWRVESGEFDWLERDAHFPTIRLTTATGQQWVLRWTDPALYGDQLQVAGKGAAAIEFAPFTGVSPSRSGVIAVVCHSGKLLVIRRSQFVRAPGKYCFPGGSVESGEEAAQAVVREMREELGCEATPLKSLWRSQSAWGIELDWWLTQIRDAESIVANPQEVDWVGWLTREEMEVLPSLLPSNRVFLQALRQGAFELPSIGGGSSSR